MIYRKFSGITTTQLLTSKSGAWEVFSQFENLFANHWPLVSCKKSWENVVRTIRLFLVSCIAVLLFQLTGIIRFAISFE